LRGARQVGKSSLVEGFSKSYEQFLSLNLERKKDAALFADFSDINQLIETALLREGKVSGKKTLLFIDEIQEVREAIPLLRYFFEDRPEIHVIAAGSLLETILHDAVSIPVGRVDFMAVRPMSFVEFMMAINNEPLLQALNSIPTPTHAHELLLEQFKIYTLIGGMPEVVARYIKEKSVSGLGKVHERIMQAYLSDIEKYASNSNQRQVISHVLKNAFRSGALPVSFEQFGNSNYRSREVGEAFRLLEKAMVLHLNYPVTETRLPLAFDHKKRPLLQLLDTGMMNYFAGIQYEVKIAKQLEDAWRGRVAEHIVRQEIMVYNYNMQVDMASWVRDKRGSEAQMDVLFPWQGSLIPIEVKSGAIGKLKSLHIYMEMSDHDLGVRIYEGKPSVHRVITPNNKKYRLVNLPYYALVHLPQWLDWADKQPV